MDWAGRCFVRRRIALVGVVAVFLVLAPRVFAQETVTFDPAATSVQYTLDATMHTVHGTFKLKHGEMQFDPATGKASGAIVVDATSGDSGNSSRDHNMHANVLESAKYPEIVFTPTLVTAQSGGKFEIRAQGNTPLQASGAFRIHGQEHEMTLPLAIERDKNGALVASGHFSIPYRKWGMKNPSNFVLKVGDTVDMEVRATVKISP